MRFFAYVTQKQKVLNGIFQRGNLKNRTFLYGETLPVIEKLFWISTKSFS